MPNRILVFVNHFYPYIGGLENSVLRIYGTMKALYPKVEIDVVCNNTESVTEFETHRGLNIYRMECWNMLGRRYSVPKPGAIRRTLKNLRDHEYDFINAHTRFFVNSLIGFLYAKVRRIPYVHTEQGASFTKLDSAWVSSISYLVDQTFGRLIITGADRVVAISTAAGRFAQKLGANGFQVVHHGIDPGEAVFDGNFKKKTPRSLVCIGRLVYGKGIQDLLRVMKEIQTEWTLKIVGDGPYKGELERLVHEYRLDEQVEFCGFMNAHGVHALLARSRVFINPTYTEGFGITTIEAGLEGCTVIASYVGGQADIIEDGVDGFLIDGFENQEARRFDLMKAKIELLLKDAKLCRTLGQRLREKVIDEFSWEKAAEAYYRLTV